MFKENRKSSSWKKNYRAFRHAKINDLILYYTDLKKNPLILTTDASNVALEAVLSQGEIVNDKPEVYPSTTLKFERMWTKI